MNRSVAQQLGLPWLMIALLVWLSAACSTNKWSHPTAGDQQFRFDNSECQDQSARSAGFPPPAWGIAGRDHLVWSKRRDEAYARCMMDKGWVRQAVAD